MRRPLVHLLPAALLATLLGGCSTPLPEPQPEAVPAVLPAALTTTQVERVLTDVMTTLEAADAAGDAALLEPRVTGPAQETRRAEYVQRAAGVADAVTEIPSGVQTVVAPATDSWPRTLMVVTEAPADLQPPLLLTLVQQSPREQFRLWSWARLFPGTQMPATARPELGSEPVAAAQELLVPPAEVVPRYADVLTQGDASEHAGTFSGDPLRPQIAALRGAYQGLTPETGSLTVTHTPADTGPYAIGTADGGALVVGPFRTVTTLTLADSTLAPGPQATALLGGATTLSTTLSMTWLGVVAFHVPPAGSDQPVTVLGGEYTMVQATGQ